MVPDETNFLKNDVKQFKLPLLFLTRDNLQPEVNLNDRKLQYLPRDIALSSARILSSSSSTFISAV